MNQRLSVAAQGIESLSQRGWLSECPEAFRNAVLGQAIWRTVSPGTAIQHAGEEQGGMCGIARGLVDVRWGSAPADIAGFHVAHAGFWSGYRPLLGCGARTVTIIARDEVVYALIPQIAMERLLAETPIWWRCIAQLVDTAMTAAGDAISDLLLRDSKRRALAVLLRMVGCRHVDAPSDGLPELRISQDDLAAMANMSRNTMRDVLAPHAAAGEIDIGYRSIVVRAPAALRQIVDEPYV